MVWFCIRRGGWNCCDVLRVINMVSDLEGLNLTSHLSAHEESMALSRSLLECGHDEDRDDEVCSYCATDGKLQPALYFCFDCGVYGKFICGKCLKHHNKFVNNHEVEKIGNQSASKRAQENDLKLKTLQHSNEELQKENSTLLADLKKVKRKNEKLSKELHDHKEAEQLKIRPKTKINLCERDIQRKESKLIYKEKDRVQIRQRETAAGTNRHKLVVVAIEIGNEWSNYAYSFQHDPLHINSGTFIDKFDIWSTKILSVVLFDENKKFHSFGFDAEKKYAELADVREHTTWFFFKHFMMKLSGKGITQNIEIEDDTGRKMKAIDVIGAAIQYLKGHLLNILEKRLPDIQDKTFNWILTVPAIWTYSAQQLMRDAASKADIAETQLTIVTEPEAAILYYQTEKQIRQLTTTDISSPGTKCMVIDLGVNTVHFTILERQSDGSLSEIKSATGLACGENMVTEEYLKLIRNIIGDAVYQKWIDEYADCQTSLQYEFGKKIRTIKASETKNETFKIPVSILDAFKEINHENIGQATERSQYKSRIKWHGDKMRIDEEIVKNMFKPCTDMIEYHVQHLLKEPEVKGTSIFLMVGRLSESPIVQETIIEAFPTVNVIIPKDPGTAVSKGAVIYGHQH